MKKTLVIGASENSERYSNKAVRKLIEFGHEVIALGAKSGLIDQTPIITEFPESISDLHTITLYLNENKQSTLANQILHLRPKRIIFNPGAENSDLAATAREQGIETVEGCTLVMLSIGVF